MANNLHDSHGAIIDHREIAQLGSLVLYRSLRDDGDEETTRQKDDDRAE